MNIGRAKPVNLGARPRVSLETLVPKGADIRTIDTRLLVATTVFGRPTELLSTASADLVPWNQSTFGGISESLTDEYINAASGMRFTPVLVVRSEQLFSPTQIVKDILSSLSNIPEPFVIAAEGVLRGSRWFLGVEEILQSGERATAAKKSSPVQMTAAGDSLEGHRSVLTEFLREKIKGLRDEVQAVLKRDESNEQARRLEKELDQFQRRLEVTGAHLLSTAAQVAMLEFRIALLRAGHVPPSQMNLELSQNPAAMRSADSISEVRRRLADPEEFEKALLYAVRSAAAEENPMKPLSERPQFLDAKVRFERRSYDIGEGVIATGEEIFKAAAEHLARESGRRLGGLKAVYRFDGYEIFDWLLEKVDYLLAQGSGPKSPMRWAIRRDRRGGLYRPHPMIKEVYKRLRDREQFEEILVRVVKTHAPTYKPRHEFDVPPFMRAKSRFEHARFEIGDGLIATGSDIVGYGKGHILEDEALQADLSRDRGPFSPDLLFRAWMNRLLTEQNQ